MGENIRPKVSVIIPVYNVDLYLRECLDSAIGQTLKDTEIICVNDGSTDKSPMILSEYREKDDRIIVIDQENRGQAAARNTGLKHAKGEYVFFLDGDDYIDPETLHRTAELADTHCLDAVVFRYEQFAESQEYMDIHPCSINAIPGDPQIFSGPEYLKAAKDCGAYSPGIWNVLWRHAFLKQNSLQFKDGLLYEDILFSFHAFMTADKVMPVPDVLYHYRARAHSISAKPITARNTEASFECSKDVLRYALEGRYDQTKENEIRREYAEINSGTYYYYSALSEDSQADISFKKEIDYELFRQVTAYSEACKLREAMQAKREENDRLRSDIAAALAESDRIKNEINTVHSSWSYRIGSSFTRGLHSK